MKLFRLIALSGSLRKASLNTAMLQMAAACAPPGLRIMLFDGLGDLPLFNPDLDLRALPAVMRLLQALCAADGAVIASPEYAHGVSGVMKNALDWMVSTEAFVDLPFALWNASPRASLGLEALRRTLAVMSADCVAEAGLSLPIHRADPGSLPVNPSPDAMTKALLALRRVLATGQPRASCSQRLDSDLAQC